MMGRRILSCAAIALAIMMGVASSAVADTRTATAGDGVDAGATFDIASARATTNRDAGVLTLDVTFHASLPATFDSSGQTSLVAWIEDDDISGAMNCFGAFPGRIGDAFIKVTPSGTIGALQASVQVKFRNTHATLPVQIAPDRLSLSVTVNDDLLKQSNHRCFQVSGSGQQAYDPSLPDGGSDYDGVDAVWFDGQQPPPAAPPTTPGAPTPPPSIPPPDNQPQSAAQICGSPLFKLSGATKVATGSTGLVRVTRIDHGDYNYDGGAKLVMADRAAGKPFSTRRFAAEHDEDAADDNGAQFFVGPDRIPAVVTLTWPQRPAYIFGHPSATCTASLAVRSIEGKAPRFYVVGGATGELIPRGQRCWEARGTRTTVTVSANGRHATFTRDDACARFRGRARTLGGLHVSRSEHGTISFLSLGIGRAQLSVRVGRQVVLRRTVISKVKSRPHRPVWQGTDEFFNYCVKGGKELYSYQLQLYCVRPGSFKEAVLFRR